LNEDLAEALALVHDFGHTPFGHAGEEALNIMMQPYGGFNHNDQTLRIITLLEQRYAEFDGLNLTWETLEGISKHNGPIFRDYSSTIQELNRSFDLQLGLYGSLESQIASLADDVAYNAHDLNDGLRAGFFSINDLLDIPLVSSTIKFLYEKYPSISDSRLIHELTRRTVNVMVDDILRETRSRLRKENPSSCQDVRERKQPMAAFSFVLRTQVDELRSFLFQRMYRHYKVNRMANKAKRVIRSLFELFMSEPSCLPSEWQHDSSHIKNVSQARNVADYIAGMTDRYALLEHERLFDLKAKV
jgi:dGTPase